MKLLRNIKYRILDYIYQKRGLMTYSGMPTPKILFIILLYAASFSLFLAGVKHIQTEQALAKYINMQTAKKKAASANKTRFYRQQDIAELQNHLAENVFRLHIVADSDTVQDQTVKLKVRDEIIDTLRESVSSAESPAQAEELIAPQIPALTVAAQRTLSRCGSEASVHITIENRYFPVKSYGDLTFPAGTYRALCVEIGKAQGQNWWCVLFPSLCFLDETTATVPEESKKILKEKLTEEEYQALEQPDTSHSPEKSPAPETSPQPTKKKPEVRSAFLDWF